jgi:uncharacterized membrane protein YbaN (DUF454 family)
VRIEKSLLIRYAKIFFGGLLTVAGIIGLILPIIPGWLLIIPGIALLSSGSPWFAGKVRPFFQKYKPKLQRLKKRILQKLHKGFLAF